jgi:FixJ family two-component response regulator
MPLVMVVDDDISVRKSLDRLMRSAGHEVNVFASAEEFLNSNHHRKADCLILDVRLPGISGVDLHCHLITQSYNVPVIFITAHESDNGSRSEAASEWTVAYLIKPLDGDQLLDAVDAALRLKSAHKQDS